MTFFKNNNKNTPYHPFIEFLIITISLIVILVPLKINFLTGRDSSESKNNSKSPKLGVESM
jgi:hypothetical protein